MPRSLNRQFVLRKKGFDLVQSGEFEKAAKIFNRLYKKNIKDTEALFMLGVIRGMQGNFSEAEIYLKKLVSKKPKMHAAYYNLALAQKNLGHVTDAIESYRRAVQLDSSIPAYSNNLGNLLLETGDSVNAIECFEVAISLDKNLPDYYYNHGRALVDSGLRQEAIDSFNKALSIRPDFILALNAIASAYFSCGALEDARESYNKVIALSPESEDAIAGLAKLHIQDRNYIVAENCLNKHISDQGSVNPVIVLAYARLAPRINQDEKAVNLLERCLESNNVSDEYRAQIYFMLGRFYDKTDNFKAAFECFEKGNNLRSRGYDITQQKKIVDKLIAGFECSVYNKANRATHFSDLPVFIIGMPRSGTTLVEQIIASHPSVSGAGELDLMPQLVDGKQSDITDYEQDEIDVLAKQYIVELTKHAQINDLRVTDKMPANYLNLAVIRMLFPDAPIIHCKRNPIDTCLSCYFQDFSGNHPYTNNLVSLGEYYVQYSRLMQYWIGELGINVLDIDYELLVRDVESVSRKIISYCGLEWSGRCLRFHDNQRVVVTASMDQVSKPIYTRSINRWENYKDFIRPLVSVL